ncbi:hypothetical protein COLO4_06466 [Corchorus olitorius]|uniref:Uncharacterized protein n=1 Tax=Corchorus olitorius TaxID=93759 RepID=A0A1R3KN00_9ROSI|nr:hypothetical protein COLO4_06466 [Corchorus olitorius]
MVLPFPSCKCSRFFYQSQSRALALFIMFAVLNISVTCMLIPSQLGPSRSHLCSQRIGQYDLSSPPSSVYFPLASLYALLANQHTFMGFQPSVHMPSWHYLLIGCSAFVVPSVPSHSLASYAFSGKDHRGLLVAMIMPLPVI